MSDVRFPIFRARHNAKSRGGGCGSADPVFPPKIITLHTFATIWWHKGVKSLVVACILVGVLWLFLVVLVVTSSSVLNEFYTPTPYWCWINSAYSNFRTAGENFWLWLALGVSVLYIPLFYWSRGYVTPSHDTWWRFQIHSRREMGFEGGQQRISMSLFHPSLTDEFGSLVHCGSWR